MNRIKKLDDKDIVFINEQWSDEERKKFSEFLKSKKKNKSLKKIPLKRKVTSKKQYA
ncbi:MAG: hypothetical protein M3R36_12875 [Bacteroidota bacterium]|nr:hypothetical protein [Bacteroidota bacterium]